MKQSGSDVVTVLDYAGENDGGLLPLESTAVVVSVVFRWVSVAVIVHLIFKSAPDRRDDHQLKWLKALSCNDRRCA